MLDRVAVFRRYIAEGGADGAGQALEILHVARGAQEAGVEKRHVLAQLLRIVAHRIHGNHHDLRMLAAHTGYDRESRSPRAHAA